MPQTQVNSATLIIGVTGSGKSSLARTLADYLWETHQKVLYYYTCDGGGFPAKVQEGIALGIIKGWRMRTRDPGDLGLAFETCYRAAQGWWPRRINPATGEVDPGVDLVAPVAKRFLMKCPSGHVVRNVPSQNMLGGSLPCPECRVMVTQQNMQVEETLIQSAGFQDRGGVFFDGLSSMLSWEMMELGQRAGRLELKGEEGAIGGKVVSGSLKFGGITRSHVGFAQTRGEELAHLALGIPNLVVPPVFTALSMEASDDAALSIIGPKIAGRAKTDEAPQWFGNCLETAKVPAETGTGEQYVLYLSEFTDTQGRRHLLKHRGAPGTMPDKLVDPPLDPKNPAQAFTQFNLGLFFRMLDQALISGIEAAKLQYPNAPGLPEGVVEYGDGNTVQGPAPAPTIGRPNLAPAAPIAAAAPAPTPQAAPAGNVAAGAAPAASAPAASKPRASRAKAAQASPTPAPAASAPQPAPAAAAAPAPAPAAPSPAEEPNPAAATSTGTPAPPATAAPAAPVAPAAPRPVAGAAPPPGARPRTAAPAAVAQAPQTPTSAPAPASAQPAAPAAVPRPPAAAPRVAAGTPARPAAAAPVKPA